MARYELVQRCRPCGEYRPRETAALLELLAEACGITSFQTNDGGEVRVRAEEIDALLGAAARSAPFPGAGADLDLYGRVGGSSAFIRCSIHSGTASGESFVDYCNVDFGESGAAIDAGVFSRAVATIRPFEAFLAELDNEESLDAYARQEEVGFGSPAIIRPLHYFDSELASRVGGIDRCLHAPAARVGRFLDGVLIELVGEAFDPANQTHLEVQRRVMQHLGMRTTTPSGDARSTARG